VFGTAFSVGVLSAIAFVLFGEGGRFLWLGGLDLLTAQHAARRSSGFKPTPEMV